MKKEIIVVNSVVYGTSTNDEAFPLYLLMDKALGNDSIIVLSLKDCNAMSSSFLNSSLGSIIDKYGWNFLKGKISIIDYNPTVANVITTYLEKSKCLTNN